MMQDARIRWTLLAVCLLTIGGSGIALYANRRAAPTPIVITPPPATPAVPLPAAAPPTPAVSEKASPAPALPPAPAIYVHVAGAVKKPSLYTLSPGCRVMQAIKAAGGPTAKADLDAVNLAEKVQDGEKVYVPEKTEAGVTAVPPGNAIGHAGVIPIADTAAAATPSTAAAMPKTTKGAKGSAGGKPAKLTSPSEGRININSASADQLERLPGIGPAMAARILAYRQQAGGFQKAEDLMEVGGIGPKKFAKIAPFVKL